MADDILKNIPLPADLPENWTSGQIIAPTGAEAGLDNQHGYNYLMKQVNNAQKAATAIAAALLNYVYPMGSLYISENPTSPAELYGGTWERIKGKFIMGASDDYPAGSTGGSATHTQTLEEGFTHSHRLMQSGENAKMNTASMGRSGSVTSDHDEYAAFGDRVQLFNLYSFTIETVGGGQPMDILNPYYSMYIWRRVA